MSRVTRFAARDSGPAARVAGFMAHLRDNGFRLGVAETDTALSALAATAPDAGTVRLALKTVACGSATDWERFDALFDAFWLNGGRVRRRAGPDPDRTAGSPHATTTREAQGADTGSRGTPSAPDDAPEGEAHGDGSGRLIASRTATLIRKDLRKVVAPQDIRAAEAIARRIGTALRDRRSRRAKAAKRGARIDFRRTLRASLPTGGEPLRLHRRTRPDRPVKIVALCDVSGSMTLYARPFLAFLAGLIRADAGADAWLFHTRLVRITGALRDEDPMRALDRLSLLADGFGGGSKIGAALAEFAAGPARARVDGRTVVMILSDGYDSADPARVGEALARLRRRGCRILWLNPLKGWEGYTPVAKAMAAALPHLDLFAPAGTLADLAALEPELCRL